MKIAIIIVVVLIMINILAWNIVRRAIKFNMHDTILNRYVGEDIEKFNKKSISIQKF